MFSATSADNWKMTGKKFFSTGREKRSIWATTTPPFGGIGGDRSRADDLTLPTGYTMKITVFCLTLMLALNFAGLCDADISYVESIDGDLSGPSTPTDVGVAGLGINTIAGTLLNSPGLDPDSFMFTVAVGHQLDSLSFISLDDSSPHFFAFNNGPVDQNPGTGNLFTGLFESEIVGVNLLDGSVPDLFGSPAAGPQGPGTYHVWFQETDGIDIDYEIQLSVSQIPEPASAAVLMLFGMSAMLARTRRRSGERLGLGCFCR